MGFYVTGHSSEGKGCALSLSGKSEGGDPSADCCPLFRPTATWRPCHCQGYSGCKEEKPAQTPLSPKWGASIWAWGFLMQPKRRKGSWAPEPERRQLLGTLLFQTSSGPGSHGILSLLLSEVVQTSSLLLDKLGRRKPHHMAQQWVQFERLMTIAAS